MLGLTLPNNLKNIGPTLPSYILSRPAVCRCRPSSMIMAELHLGLSMNMGIQYIYIYIYIRLLKVNIKVERILHQVHLKLKFHYLLVELNPTSYGSENRTPPEQFWGELATQLVLAAAPSCRAARSRRALHLHSVRTAPSREQLSAAMRELYTSS